FLRQRKRFDGAVDNVVLQLERVLPAGPFDAFYALILLVCHRVGSVLGTLTGFGRFCRAAANGWRSKARWDVRGLGRNDAIHRHHSEPLDGHSALPATLANQRDMTA